jgi:hypothetical protein
VRVTASKVTLSKVKWKTLTLKFTVAELTAIKNVRGAQSLEELQSLLFKRLQTKIHKKITDQGTLKTYDEFKKKLDDIIELEKNEFMIPTSVFSYETALRAAVIYAADLKNQEVVIIRPKVHSIDISDPEKHQTIVQPKVTLMTNDGQKKSDPSSQGKGSNPILLAVQKDTKVPIRAITGLKQIQTAIEHFEEEIKRDVPAVHYAVWKPNSWKEPYPFLFVDDCQFKTMHALNVKYIIEKDIKGKDYELVPYDHISTNVYVQIVQNTWYYRKGDLLKPPDHQLWGLWVPWKRDNDDGHYPNNKAP